MSSFNNLCILEEEVERVIKCVREIRKEIPSPEGERHIVDIIISIMEYLRMDYFLLPLQRKLQHLVQDDIAFSAPEHMSHHWSRLAQILTVHNNELSSKQQNDLHQLLKYNKLPVS
jgi:hypothetical protein